MRAPTTLGTHLRGFTFGHVRQLDAIASRLLIALAGRTPLLAGADSGAFLDLDDTIRETHGYAKQGVGYGYSKVKGLNALLAVALHGACGAGDRRDPATQGVGPTPSVARRG